jgi:DNA invertase Pin-like site-specific DNA recombinase
MLTKGADRMNTKAPYGYTMNEQGTGYEIDPEKVAEVGRLIAQMGPAKRAAIYARTATSQEPCNSLPVALQEQIKQAQAYCAERGYALDAERHIYQEIASGNKGDRPQLTALRQAAREGQFTILVVSSFDRLARSSIQQAAIINDLMQAGITVESVQEPYGSNDALLLATSVQAGMETLMRERLRARTQHGKATKKAPQEQ